MSFRGSRHQLHRSTNKENSNNTSVVLAEVVSLKMFLKSENCILLTSMGFWFYSGVMSASSFICKYGKYEGHNTGDEEYKSDDWEIYLERLDQHFTANNIGDEKIKTAILLSSIGQESYKLLRDLCIPDLPKTKAFEELCTLLNKQFGVHMSVWRERRKFHHLKQTDETITEWYAKIHSFSITQIEKRKIWHIFTVQLPPLTISQSQVVHLYSSLYCIGNRRSLQHLSSKFSIYILHVD
ncbi:hypothetical protein NQ315_014740 [Exocentrus adspersus]|uniref:LAGLIDADG homing endonuclease n=1 Tax=Exocentrus adspersus TaxID=1586481 RepID=A0AAV8VE12_9CUCU|nr:hypothetical protein NQ315_014740 [Exocentrus adspersus]